MPRELTYEPLTRVESTRQKPMPAGRVRDQRSECPHCGGTINRVVKSQLHWDHPRGDFTVTCCIFCDFCDTAFVGEFPCDKQRNLTSNRALHNSCAVYHDTASLLEAHPELAAGEDLG